MNCLLDSHTYLWWLADPTKIGETARSQLCDPANTVFVSVVTFWELSIKISLGKLSLARDISRLVAELPDDGMRLLEISTDHCVTVAKLPFHHRDPFDRMLLSQAIREDLTLLSCDQEFQNYPVRLLWS